MRTRESIYNDGYPPITLEAEKRRAAIRKRPLRPRRKAPEFQCMECGRKFYSVKAAERASYNGCPMCNSSDIDIFV